MEIKKSYLNALAKASTTSYFKDYRNAYPELDHEATNPFSGVTVKLNALEATIYEFCKRWYARYEAGVNTEVPVSTFDNMRYYLLTLNSHAYMELLD